MSLNREKRSKSQIKFGKKTTKNSTGMEIQNKIVSRS
jgi:hypothetical protein